jgi:hypothetical protein
LLFNTEEKVAVDALLTTIALWLSINFGLPASYDHPRVEFLPAAEITALRYGSSVDQARARDVVSVYHNATKTIYLPENWMGNTPAELSILVHEMVHHLQNTGKLKFECPQEREQVAYKAQERWLEMFGRDLLRDFELDPFTLLVITKCAF